MPQGQEGTVGEGEGTVREGYGRYGINGGYRLSAQGPQGTVF